MKISKMVLHGWLCFIVGLGYGYLIYETNTSIGMSLVFMGFGVLVARLVAEILGHD